jgi:deoxyribodipyrimidine photo-lyase
LKKDGKPYTIFTPFFKNASKQEILPPKRNTAKNYFHGKIPFAEDKSLLDKLLPKQTALLLGGRKEALKILKLAA